MFFDHNRKLKIKILERKKQQNSIVFLSDTLSFPPLETANSEGLLAVGGDLSSERLLLAYQNGIFPWFNENSLIMWWSPDPRMVLFPKEIKVSKSMKQVLRNNQFRLTENTCFAEVVDQCASIAREGQDGTWITREMKEAYLELHKKGYAKSYEVWEDDELVGGLYGVDLGNVFCGESMFSLTSNASKFAFIHLARKLVDDNYTLIDCQMYTDHLASMGAKEIPRSDFMNLLKR